MSSTAHARQIRETEASSTIVATGGLLYLVGAVAFVVHLVCRSVLTAGVDPVDSAQLSLWVPVNALGAVGATLVLLGMPAVYAPIARRGGRPGLAGFALIEASWAFFGLFLSLYGALVMPWLADKAPRLVDGSSAVPLGITVAFAIGWLAWLAGALLLAVPFVGGAARPRWAGYLLPISALWFLTGSVVIAPDGPASNLAVNLLSNLGPVLLLIAIGAPGISDYLSRRAS